MVEFSGNRAFKIKDGGSRVITIPTIYIYIGYELEIRIMTFISSPLSS